jgi:hypothetical protein
MPICNILQTGFGIMYQEKSGNPDVHGFVFRFR